MNLSPSLLRQVGLSALWRAGRDASLRLLDEMLPVVCVACEQPLSPGQPSGPGASPRGWCAGCAASLPGLGVQRCPRCGERLAATGSCRHCRHHLPVFDHCIALADYARPLDHLVQAIKFGRQAALAAPLGRLLARACIAGWPAGVPAPDAVVPVPLAPARLARRGFNQARLLARPVAAAFGLTPAHGLLRRTRDTLPASSLDARQRRQVLRAAFTAPPVGPATTLLIVDDVMTTGATLQAAAGALKAAGAVTVVVCVACRTATPAAAAAGDGDGDGDGSDTAADAR
ncbi:MAG: ComF family protein [Burkholderiaceae bacterium]